MSKVIKIGVWGFYEQGNFGDDLMAIMFYDLIKDAGFEPIIISSSSRFRDLGYQSIPSPTSTELSALVIGGGAFFKSDSATSVELNGSVKSLLEVMDSSDVPIFALSIGSDGVNVADDISATRRAIVEHKNFKGGFVRLSQDLSLGFRNFNFLPDIVLSASHHINTFRGERAVDKPQAKLSLYNFSRRAIPYIPIELWRGRRLPKALFLSHSTTYEGRNDVRVPLMSAVASDDIFEAIGNLSCCRSITSSKLHPGMAALSFGRTFYALAPRSKTKAVIADYEKKGILDIKCHNKNKIALKLVRDASWQAKLWKDYRLGLSGLVHEYAKL